VAVLCGNLGVPAGPRARTWPAAFFVTGAVPPNIGIFEAWDSEITAECGPMRDRRVWTGSVIAVSPRSRRSQPASPRNAIGEVRVNPVLAYGTAEGLEHIAVGSGTPSGTTAVPSGIGRLTAELSVSHLPAASIDSVFGICGPVSGGF